ncbi:unnamed protein product [Peniophora sp. CBMAI 1063]|nr:unnamed protein product [Peniophora sp. CBMAI 1063]
MNVPGPSSHSHSHRRGTSTRARENQNALPRTFLRARGGLGDPPTTTSAEDDVFPRRERKKRSRGVWSGTPTPGQAGPSGHANINANTDIDIGKPLPRPPSKLRQATRAESSSQAPFLNVRPAKATSKGHKQRAAALPAVTFVAETDEEGYDSQSTLGRGSAASSELSKLQAQILELKKQLKDKEKQADDHLKHATKYKREVQNLHKSSKEQRAELDKLRDQHQRNSQIVSDVEQSLQCQICIDTLSRPYALSPCGHVLCLACLQDWFRHAPLSAADMDTSDDEMPSLVHRTKSCPVCRAKVKERPLQLYMLKAVIAAVDGAREKRESPPLDLGDDPWEGIFPSLIGVEDEDLEDLEDLTTSEEEEEDDEEGSSMDDEASDEDGGLLDVYDNSSDDDYEGDWVRPTWAPPHITHPARLHPEPFFDALLRRGATLPMIERFDMDYTHADGLSVQNGDMRVYLGWNVWLDEEDGDGGRLVEWLEEDMDARPERWVFESGGRVAVRLVRGDGERYQEADSEDWIDEESEEEGAGHDEDEEEDEDDEDEEMN